MKRVWMLTAIFVASSAVVDIALRRFIHADFWWHTVPAFDLVYGFAGCAAIVLFSKWLGTGLVARDEDYYERDR